MPPGYPGRRGGNGGAAGRRPLLVEDPQAGRVVGLEPVAGVEVEIVVGGGGGVRAGPHLARARQALDVHRVRHLVGLGRAPGGRNDMPMSGMPARRRWGRRLTRQSSAYSRDNAMSISSSVTVSGGTKRRVAGPVALMTRRCSSSARRAIPGASAETSAATIRPRARTS